MRYFFFYKLWKRILEQYLELSIIIFHVRSADNSMLNQDISARYIYIYVCVDIYRRYHSETDKRLSNL